MFFEPKQPILKSIIFILFQKNSKQTSAILIDYNLFF